MEWLTWLGPAVGIAGLIFSIFAYRANRKRKILTCETEVDQEIGTPARYGHWGDLIVALGDRRIENPRIITVAVRNSGQVEVRPEDFSEPLSASSANGDKIVSAKIVVSGSAELEPVAVTERMVTAPAMLLNTDECVRFHLLLDGVSGDVSVGAHIAGGEMQEKERRSSETFGLGKRGLVAPSIAVLATLVVIVMFVISQRLVFADHASVPDVRSKLSIDAINEINNAGLSVSGVMVVDNPGGFVSGTVISESPTRGDSRPRGTGVLLQ
jgi:hypothetical protein